MRSREVLASKIRAFRKANKLSREEFAKIANLSARGISKIEHCEVGATLDTLDMLASAIGVTASELLVNEAEG